MSTVEAAASLFGSEDPASDPFAVLGNDASSTSAPPESHQGDNSSVLNPSHSSMEGASLFGADDGGTTNFDPLTETGEHQTDGQSVSSAGYAAGESNYSQAWRGENGYQSFFDQAPQDAVDESKNTENQLSAPNTAHYSYNPISSHTSSPFISQDFQSAPSHVHGSETTVFQNSTQYGLSNTQEQAHGTGAPYYDSHPAPQVAYTSYTQTQTAPNYNPPSSMTTPSTHAMYDSYGSSSSAFPPGAPYTTTSQGYDGYSLPPAPSTSVSRPRTTNAYDPPLPPVKANSAYATYDAYRPPVSNVSHTTSAAPPSNSQTAHAMNSGGSTILQPQLSPLASVNRPKTANAYDPPIPSIKPRHGTSGMGRSVSPSVGQHHSYVPSNPSSVSAPSHSLYSTSQNINSTTIQQVEYDPYGHSLSHGVSSADAAGSGIEGIEPISAMGFQDDDSIATTGTLEVFMGDGISARHCPVATTTDQRSHDPTPRLPSSVFESADHDQHAPVPLFLGNDPNSDTYLDQENASTSTTLLTSGLDSTRHFSFSDKSLPPSLSEGTRSAAAYRRDHISLDGVMSRNSEGEVASRKSYSGADRSVSPASGFVSLRSDASVVEALPEATGHSFYGPQSISTVESSHHNESLPIRSKNGTPDPHRPPRAIARVANSYDANSPLRMESSLPPRSSMGTQESCIPGNNVLEAVSTGVMSPKVDDPYDDDKADAHREPSLFVDGEPTLFPEPLLPQDTSTEPYALSHSNQYEPNSNWGVKRSVSPEASVAPSGTRASPDPYAPPKNRTTVGPPELRNRSTSNGSMLSVSSSTGNTHYASTRQGRQQTSDISDYGNYTSRYDYPNSVDGEPHGTSLMHTYTAGQELSLPAPAYAAYAPSPSLLGTNDPLGRTTAHVPVFSFGFGGKAVTCFHGSSALNTGFDVALSSRQSTDISIRPLHSIIPESALDLSLLYPGPLFLDPGTPTTSLVRAGVSTQVKTKKSSITNYLDERAEEISRGFGYLNSGSPERRQAEGKLILVKLLRIMVENDGRLSGSPQIDSAVRTALIPRLSITASGPSEDSSLVTPALGFASNPILGPDMTPTGYGGLGLSPSDLSEKPITVSVLRSSTLDQIQECLIHGQRRKAYHYAMDQKLWAHSMVIASSIDKDAWKEVVTEFLKTELGAKPDINRSAIERGFTAPLTVTNDRGPLRVAYSMFSGQGAACIQELIPQTLSMPTSNMQMHGPQSSNVQVNPTPLSPNFPLPTVASSTSSEALSRWTETTAMLLSSPMTAESSSALTALGDCLAANQWTEAAHVCYLLAPQSSSLGGIWGPSTRVVLLGARSPQVWPSFYRDHDPIIFTEIAEFALSLAKGQESFYGLPHLQAYRFIHAVSLVELGHVQLAGRYCEAITAALGRPSPFFTATLLEQLDGLSDRIVGAPGLDKSASWIGGKMPKPSLDSTLNWLEGRFTKLITGDGETSPPATEDASQGDQQAFGPFSHYSTISSATTSASPSPQLSTVNLNVLPPPPPPPRRTGSALGLPHAPHSHVIDRASSAMEHVRRKPSPGPRVASASAMTNTFAQSSSFGQAINGYLQSSTLHSGHGSIDTVSPVNDDTERSESSWWSSYTAESASTPTATTFLRVDDAIPSSSEDGFISLMGNSSVSVTPSLQSKNHSPLEDEDDLGFGNSSKSKAKPSNVNSKQSTPATEETEPPRPEPELKPAASSSWLSRWWSRGDTPKPTKASLGDEKTFYYDNELKRWVNKNAGAEPQKPAAPPPPSRSQTASPGRSKATIPPSSVAPPLRSASAIDLSTSPPSKSTVRARSNLVPPTERDSPVTTPTTSAFDSPPLGRPKSQASRRNIRSRYVDVLHQPVGDRS